MTLALDLRPDNEKAIGHTFKKYWTSRCPSGVTQRIKAWLNESLKVSVTELLTLSNRGIGARDAIASKNGEN